MPTGGCRGAHRKTLLLDCKLKRWEERLNKLETSEITPTPQELSPTEMRQVMVTTATESLSVQSNTFSPASFSMNIASQINGSIVYFITKNTLQGGLTLPAKGLVDFTSKRRNKNNLGEK